MKPNEQLTVSPETQAFIECLESLNSHWEQTKRALRKTYSEKISCELMDSGYNKAYDDMKQSIQTLLLLSIDNNIGLVDFKEI